MNLIRVECRVLEFVKKALNAKRVKNKELRGIFFSYHYELD